MTTSAPPDITFAPHFGDVTTLAEMAEVVDALNAGHAERLRAWAPPEGVFVSGPRVSARTGSLFVEIAATPGCLGTWR
ncbi:hypothetical protein [Lentzea sp. NBRC 102530]|uniref:hypothetical protein n=1 Tax=Lentzea sp. NBRC 102530 TaxID=3032201 RepID=UPI0024A59B68|nr:hypothetical protein [Lentzea sp. NBRC 102530]GLY53582.1 hypothetical protein Lesp01_72380 [Lentzea sp. NBRC 102530]